MSRRPLLTVLAVAAIGLAACGTAEVGDAVADAVALSPAATETAPLPTDPEVEDEGPGTDRVPAAPAEPDTSAPAPAQDAPAAAPVVEDEGPGTEAAPVARFTLAFDGREVPVAEACTGVDGAILATTEGEVTITLVREEGTALRYQAEGATAETDAVTVEGGTDTTTYRAPLSSQEVPAVDVVMVVMDDAQAALPPC